ncbi:MAG: DUF692 domain-containing protein [Deltaproteobacteria bacterium]|nr:MAG: DUF692 domain-containing protein [Deltaproteobacteria bacterium]
MSDVNGVGIGLRMEMAKELLEKKPAEVKWLEIHPENYMNRGGRFPTALKQAMEKWPIATHGLTMCYGRAEPFAEEYTTQLKQLLSDVQSPWHSDHLCFSDVDGVFAHDLLPLPFTEEAAKLYTRRIIEARDATGCENLAFENVSYYAESPDSESDEVTFCLEVLEAADCKMLLDVNNVYVNAKNLGFDPRKWIDQIPAERVVQIHVAGHLVRHDGFRIDTHGEDICDDVYDLLDYTLRRIGPKPVLLERDGNFIPVDELLEQVRRLSEIYDRATEGAR